MIGFLNVYKPSGMTSNAVVQQVKKNFKIKKIGHMGTLDPMACGILPLAVGKATRLFDYSLQKTKKYIAIFDFGFETDTLDITGEIVARNKILVKKEDLIDVIPNLIGEINQIPPKYSAKNINGARAYDLARQGIDFELKPKLIEIYDIKLLEDLGDNKFKFSIECSSGTYIRAIGRDLAKLLNTYATMSYLERVMTGEFDVETSIHLEELLKCNSLEDCLVSPLKVFKNFDTITITRQNYIDLLNGKHLKWSRIDKYTFLICENQLIGVSEKDTNQLVLKTYLEERGDV